MKDKNMGNQTLKVKDYELKLLELRDRLREEIQERVKTVPEQLQARGDVSSLPTHKADQDAGGVDAESATDEVQKELLAEVEGALDRIEQGSFGKCADCGGPIAEERLKALPHAAFCIECEQKRESK